MGRILALDIGQKRIGLAVTDPGRIIASPLETLPVKDIWEYLTRYIPQNDVDALVIGYPLQMDGSPSEAARFVKPFINRFKKLFPEVPVNTCDERFTSVMALAAIRESGVSRKKRQDKSLSDKVSAAIMLQSYMQHLQTASINQHENNKL
jgi:putative holliday junction resolvase